MFERILLCSDGSEGALHAARMAAAMAHAAKATIEVLNVYNLAETTAPYAAAPEALSCAEFLVEIGQNIQRDILKETGAVLAKEGIEAQTRAEIGYPVDTIVRIAAEEKSDLIILGSHGAGGIRRMLLGSVSDGLAHHAPCPVLVVRGETTRIREILTAFDGSEGSGKAARAAAALAKMLQASLTLIHVFEAGKALSGIETADLDVAAYAQRVRQTLMERAEKALEGTEIPYRFCQEQGHPAEATIRFADANAMDLIVLGRRGLGGFQRLILGSVSDAVLNHAHCPVLVVP